MILPRIMAREVGRGDICDGFCVDADYLQMVSNFSHGSIKFHKTFLRTSSSDDTDTEAIINIGLHDQEYHCAILLL